MLGFCVTILKPAEKGGVRYIVKLGCVLGIKGGQCRCLHRGRWGRSLWWGVKDGDRGQSHGFWRWCLISLLLSFRRGLWWGKFGMLRNWWTRNW